MTAVRSLSIALGLARRSTRKLLKNPVPGLPPLLIPLFMFAAFAGALSAIATTKSFDYYSFTAFQFVFILYMAAMLTGAFSAFEIASDFEGGMGNRLMSAAPQRMAIVGGYLIFAIGRFIVSLVIVWGIALLVGLSVRGGPLDVAGLIALALLLNIATTLYGAGVALRMQSLAAGTLVLIPIFIGLFLSPVFVPRQQLSGWLRTVADVNPLTAAIEAGRGFLANDPVSVGLAFAVTFGLVILFAVFAATGMIKAEQGPGGGGGRRARGPRSRRPAR
jgi:ABC-2 type transport system permease protein